jgi:predicted phage tail protein
MTIGYQNGHASRPSTDMQDQSVKDLVKSLSEETSRLVRDEIKLATLELKEKGKHAGIGVGMFGAAGVVALYGAGALLACAIMALALAVAPWLSALIIAGVLFALAGILALLGKKQVTRAVPPAPEDAISNVKTDIAVIKESAHK